MRVETCSLTPGMRQALMAVADHGGQRRLFLKGYAIISLMCAALVGLFIGISAAIDGKPLPFGGPMTILFSLAAGAVIAAVGTREMWRRIHTEADAAQRHLRSGSAERVSLDMPDRHLVIDNGGRLACFFPIPGTGTVFFDIGARAGDPRLETWKEGALFRRTWTWKRLPGDQLRVWDFETSGGDVAKPRLMHERLTSDEDWFDRLALKAWPRDGEIVPVSAGRLDDLAALLAAGPEPTG